MGCYVPLEWEAPPPPKGGGIVGRYVCLEWEATPLYNGTLCLSAYALGNESNKFIERWINRTWD